MSEAKPTNSQDSTTTGASQPNESKSRANSRKNQSAGEQFILARDFYRLVNLPTDTGDSLRDHVNSEFNQAFSPIYAIEVRKAEKVRDRVLTICSKQGEGDLANMDPLTRTCGYYWCSAAHTFFLENKWYAPAKYLWLELWERLGDRQRLESRGISRAIIAQFLTETDHAAGNVGEAFRWSILAFADDALFKSTSRSKSEHWLYRAYGLHTREMTLITSTAQNCRRANRGRWPLPTGFADEVTRLLSESPEGAATIMRYSIRDEFPLSRCYLQALLSQVKPVRKAEKGSTLENLASYLFSLFGGCIPQRNVIDLAGASEHDLVVFNYASDDNNFAARFGAQFLVECKNWNRPVNVSAVGYFLQRMHVSRCRFGVILSREGITGSGERKNAESLIHKAFHRDGAICVVVKLSDIEALCKSKSSSVTRLLVQKANELQFGKPRKRSISSSS